MHVYIHHVLVVGTLPLKESQPAHIDLGVRNASKSQLVQAKVRHNQMVVCKVSWSSEQLLQASLSVDDAHVCATCPYDCCCFCFDINVHCQQHDYLVLEVIWEPSQAADNNITIYVTASSQEKARMPCFAFKCTCLLAEGNLHIHRPCCHTCIFPLAAYSLGHKLRLHHNPERLCSDH